MTRIAFRRFVLLAAGAFCASSTLSAQTCAGTQDFSGPYVFTSIRLLYAAQSASPPGTTAAAAPLVYLPQADAAPGTAGQYSLTPIGQLVGRASSSAAPFSNVGRVLADGAGVLYANRGNDPTFTRAGSYTVSNDCVMTMALSDGFYIGKEPLPAVSFQGVLTDRGGEANLVQTSLGSGTMLNFVRPLIASGCSALSLSGLYGLSAMGVDLTPEANPGGFSATPVAPVVLAARFNADGGGLIGPPTGGAGYTGAYVVNSDCTGAMTLISPDKRITRKAAFVLTANGASTGQVPRASLLFVLDDPGKLAGIGEAR
jgi:hypothetical protein